MSDLFYLVDLYNDVLDRGGIVPCYHPLDAVRLPWTSHPKTGKPIVRVIGSDWVEPFAWYREGKVPERIQLPCGQCIGCRLTRSREWANRCMLELQYHQQACFLTLTYNDQYVPRSYYTDSDTGEAFESLSLCRRDVQLFMKRLRKRYGSGIRFYGCGEYGPQTLRPHYHLIIFGFKPDDLVPWSRSEQGFQYYLSHSLQELWSERLASPRYGYTNVLTADEDFFFSPIGNILVADVSWETCAYVARYCTKKLTGAQSGYYKQYNLVPPFAMMSNRPGIAHQWYEDHPDCYDYDYIAVSTPTGGRQFKPPRYFDKLYDVDEPEKMAEIKFQRKKQAEHAMAVKVHLSYYNETEILMVEEALTEARIKSLVRKL